MKIEVSGFNFLTHFFVQNFKISFLTSFFGQKNRP